MFDFRLSVIDNRFPIICSDVGSLFGLCDGLA